MKVGTIEEEATLCRAAFAGSKVGDMAWCVHHSMLCEPLTEPAESRIQYILAGKPEEERARRLHEMRPVKGKLPAELDAAYAELDAARAKLDAIRAEWAAAGDKWYAAYAELDAACAKWVAARAKWNAACDKWNAAGAELDAACAKWNAACDKWNAAGDKYKPVLEALHVVECPDSTWNGTSIF